LSALGFFTDNAKYMSDEVKGEDEVFAEMLKEAEAWQRARLENAKEWAD
jgi:hypothetical protein